MTNEHEDPRDCLGGCGCMGPDCPCPCHFDHSDDEDEDEID